MKYIYIMALILTNVDLVAQEQGFAIYGKKSELHIPSDTLDVRFKTIIQEGKKNIKNLSYILKFDKTTSVYQEEDKLDIEENTTNKVSRILSGFNGIIYIDNKSDKIIQQTEVMGKTFFVESKISDIKWEITKEKDKIGKYNCIKAFTYIKKEGRSGVKKVLVEAWFAPEINIQHGPEGLSGLPGLIIRVKKDNIITTLSDLNFEDLKSNITIPIEKTLSQDEFNIIMKDMSMNRRKYYNKN